MKKKKRKRYFYLNIRNGQKSPLYIFAPGLLLVPHPHRKKDYFSGVNPPSNIFGTHLGTYCTVRTIISGFKPVWVETGATWRFSLQACVSCLLWKCPRVLERTYCPCFTWKETEQTKQQGRGMMNSLDSELPLLGNTQDNITVLYAF